MTDKRDIHPWDDEWPADEPFEIRLTPKGRAAMAQTRAAQEKLDATPEGATVQPVPGAVLISNDWWSRIEERGDDAFNLMCLINSSLQQLKPFPSAKDVGWTRRKYDTAIAELIAAGDLPKRVRTYRGWLAEQ